MAKHLSRCTATAGLARSMVLLSRHQQEDSVEPVEIDGSEGEGGGQMLRTALSLSAITGRPFRMHRIRAGREKPGLKRQHLTCVTSLQAVCDADVRGAELGSSSLWFSPKQVVHGDRTINIGTAGSTCLVLQTLVRFVVNNVRAGVVAVRVERSGG